MGTEYLHSFRLLQQPTSHLHHVRHLSGKTCPALIGYFSNLHVFSHRSLTATETEIISISFIYFTVSQCIF